MNYPDRIARIFEVSTDFDEAVATFNVRHETDSASGNDPYNLGIM